MEYPNFNEVSDSIINKFYQKWGKVLPGWSDEKSCVVLRNRRGYVEAQGTDDLFEMMRDWAAWYVKAHSNLIEDKDKALSEYYGLLNIRVLSKLRSTYGLTFIKDEYFSTAITLSKKGIVPVQFIAENSTLHVEGLPSTGAGQARAEIRMLLSGSLKVDTTENGINLSPYNPNNSDVAEVFEALVDVIRYNHNHDIDE